MDDIIVSFPYNGEDMTIFKNDDGYHVKHGDRIVQPNHDADGIIRYLSMALFNEDYMREQRAKHTIPSR